MSVHIRDICENIVMYARTSIDLMISKILEISNKKQYIVMDRFNIDYIE